MMKSYINKFNYNIIECILHKDSCWEHEKEWRIVIGNIDCQLPIDIVSSIIIDERSLMKPNALKLMRLCKKRSWKLKIRKRHLYDSYHEYEVLS